MFYSLLITGKLMPKLKFVVAFVTMKYQFSKLTYLLYLVILSMMDV